MHTDYGSVRLALHYIISLLNFFFSLHICVRFEEFHALHYTITIVEVWSVLWMQKNSQSLCAYTTYWTMCCKGSNMTMIIVFHEISKISIAEWRHNELLANSLSLREWSLNGKRQANRKYTDQKQPNHNNEETANTTKIQSAKTFRWWLKNVYICNELLLFPTKYSYLYMCTVMDKIVRMTAVFPIFEFLLHFILKTNVKWTVRTILSITKMSSI